ncbi:MAG: hypothetical protein ACT4QF_17285 [Sporichthyaceae bacterium]
MTQLKVTCPACGHVRILAEDVRIVVGERGSYYVFACPDCTRRVKRPVTEDVVDELVARGVPAVRSVHV